LQAAARAVAMVGMEGSTVLAVSKVARAAFCSKKTRIETQCELAIHM
jgi:hypothetical protein